jgi:hypothetical protein
LPWNRRENQFQGSFLFYNDWKDLLLICAQSGYGITFGCLAGGNQSAQKRQEDTEKNQDYRVAHRQVCIDIIGFCKIMYHHISRNQEDQSQQDSHQTGTKADDDGFSVKHLGDVPLGGADGPENTDFFFSLQHADISDDADHDGGYDQGDGHKGNQYITDNIHDVSDGRHQCAHHIGIGDDLFIFSFFFHPLVIVIQDFNDFFFAFKVYGIDADFCRFGEIHVSKGLQITLIGGTSVAGRRFLGHMFRQR